MGETRGAEFRAFLLVAADEEGKQREEHQATITAQQAESARRAWVKFAPGWEREPEHVEGRRVFIGGLVLRHLPGYGAEPSRFQLLGECPACGQTDWSVPCLTAAAIGEQLGAFKPGREHVCPSRPGCIKDGDVVTVLFIDDNACEGWTVISRPGNAGEMWDFRAPDGSVVSINPCASSFEGVYLESKKDKEETT